MFDYVFILLDSLLDMQKKKLLLQHMHVVCVYSNSEDKLCSHAFHHCIQIVSNTLLWA